MVLIKYLGSVHFCLVAKPMYEVYTAIRYSVYEYLGH